MTPDFEQLFKDQIQKVTDKVQEMARDAVKDDLTKLHAEVAELRTRLTTLEQERAQAAADSLEASF